MLKNHEYCIHFTLNKPEISAGYFNNVSIICNFAPQDDNCCLETAGHLLEFVLQNNLIQLKNMTYKPTNRALE